MSERTEAATLDQRRAATRAWLAEVDRKRIEAAEKLSEAHFAETEKIPDLEFLPPDCPVCFEATEFDDDRFVCEVCRVAWPSNGYGSQAERWED